MSKRPKSAFYLLLAVCLSGAGLPAVVHAVDFSTVPGVVLDYEELYYVSFISSAPSKFVADPEIAVLPDGNYIAAHSWSGWGTDADTSGITSLFRSTDKGVTWTSLGTQTGILRASLFVYNGALYLLGAAYEGGAAVIMTSTDDGTSWTSAAFTLSGPATPNNPVVWSNRLWSAAGTVNYSASINSNLLVEASWKRTAGFPAASNSWLSGTSFIGEGQIVASPELGVFILPKVKQYAYTTVARVESAGTVRFDPINNFAALPGGEKKFGAAYDAGSGKFYVLSNPLLQDGYDSGLDYDMIRNTAAMLSSRDLLNWKVEKIFLYSTYVGEEGFGYLNFDFDGTNMVVAARTAFRLPGEKYPERGHDSNLLTFHRINDFRNLAPDQYLTISGNQVLRYERTQHAAAPLGSFTLGNIFAGAALTGPNGIGTNTAGDVFIREAGGRILHFDALGNFIETNSSAPVAFSASQINARPPSAGECSWMRSTSGDWSDLLNWYYWGRADTTEEIAVFGSAAVAAATITIPAGTQIWNFNTAGDVEGWAAANASNAVAGGGFLQGSANTTSSVAAISRVDRFFYGSTVPEVRIRLKADANCTVNFYWATTVADSVGSTPRKLTQTYTGNGDFQELVFPMTGNTNWEGKAITRLRFDPLVQTNAAGRGFAIDSITVTKECCRIKGLRFRNPYPYTLSGTDRLRIEAASGSGSIEVLQGGHTNDVALILGSDTDMTLTNSTSLHLKKGIDLNGKTLHVTGSGRLLMQGALVMNGGTIAVNGTAPLTLTNNLTGASLAGTLQFLPEGTFTPSAGTGFDLLDNQSLLGTNRFAAVSLPALPAGLKWNTNTLYSAGTISVEAVQQSLTVATLHGSASPAAGTNIYNYGTNLTARLTNSPVLNGTTTQYVCRGWSGTGSVPAGGTSANTGVFTLTNDSTIAWLWSTNYWLETEATVGGSITALTIAGIASETVMRENFDWGAGVPGREAVTNGQNIHGMAVSDYGTNVWTMYGVSSANSAAKFSANGSVTVSGTGTVLRCAYTNWADGVITATAIGTYTPDAAGSQSTKRFCIGFQTAGVAALMGAGSYDSIQGDLNSFGVVFLRAKISGTNYFSAVTNNFSSFTGGDTVTMVLAVDKANESATLITTTSSGTVTNVLNFSAAPPMNLGEFAVNARYGTLVLDSVNVVPDPVPVSDGWQSGGAVVQIAANADAYCHFTGWSGDTTTNSSQITLLMNRACSVTANFAVNVTTNTGTPEWWLAQFGLTNYSAAAAGDADGDGLLTWQEYIAGTNPTNPASSLRITGCIAKSQGAVIRWSSVSNRSYSLSRTTNLMAAFTAVAGAINLPATPPENAYTNPVPNGASAFYRISTQQ